MNNLVLFICALSLMVLSLPGYDLGWLSFFSLIPLFLLVRECSYALSFYLSWFLGSLYVLILLFWLGGEARVFIPFSGIFSYLFIFLCVVGFGLCIGVFGFFAKGVLDSEIHFFAKSIGIAGVWVTIELGRSYLVSGCPWSLLAYNLYQHPMLIQSAEWTGAYGVSFFVCLINVLIYFFLIAKKHSAVLQSLIAVLILFCINLTLAYSVVDKFDKRDLTKVNSLNITTVQTNFSLQQNSRSSFVSKILAHEKLMTLNPNVFTDLTVWSESSIGRVDSALPAKYLSKFSKQKPPILYGVVEKNGSYFDNKAIILSDGEPVYSRSKNMLVPFAEDEGLKRIHSDAMVSSMYNKPDRSSYRIKGLSFSPLICYEMLCSVFVSKFTQKNNDFFVNMSNDSWAGSFKEGRHQALSSVIFRAVENRRAIVRSANTGISGFIDATGRLVKSIPEQTAGIATHTVYAPLIQTTMYTRYGDWFAHVCCLLTFCWIVLLVYKHLINNVNKET